MTMTGKGALVAAAVAGLFSAATPFTASAKSKNSIQCQRVNACKGKSACHSADNACADQNGCKGKGWTMMSEKDCKDKGGKVMGADKGAEKKK